MDNLRRKQFGVFVVDINYNNLNQVESSVNPLTGTRNYVHDDRGNVRWRGHLRFGYSGAHRPTSLMSDESGTLKSIGAYRYDGHGRRVKSITKTDEGDITRYNIFDASGALVWVVQLHPDGGDENHVTNYVGMDTGSGPGASGQTIARVKSVGTRINYVDEVTYLHNDHLGSAVAGTDASGAIVFKERYLPFGGTQVNNAANENQAGFTGHIKDTDTGLTYMQARYYDPEIGRFLSHDPVTMMSAGDTNQFNRYVYASNDPVNKFDPDGNDDIFVGGQGDSGWLGSKIVKKYSSNWASYRPGRTTSYRAFNHQKGIVKDLTAAAKSGGPVNVACHSRGCAHAMSAIKASGIEVDNLVTVDPVNAGVPIAQEFDGQRPENIANWTNVEGTPTEGNHHSSDTIEGIGEAISGEFDTSGADNQISTTANHGNFDQMFGASSNSTSSGAKRFDNSYNRTGSNLRKRKED